MTVAQILKSAGYATACVGKWGMGMFDTTGSPLKVGFDHFFGYNCQRHAHSYFPKYLYRDDQRFELPGNDGNTKVDGTGPIYAQDLIADETLKFVKANKDRPFFLYYSITLPTARFTSTIRASTRTSRGPRSRRTTPRWSRASTPTWAACSRC